MTPTYIDRPSVVHVHERQLSRREPLSSSALRHRIERAIFPVGVQLTMAVQLGSDPANARYTQLIGWQMSVATPAAVHAVKRYLCDCMRQLDGLIVQDGPDTGVAGPSSAC